MLRPNEVDLDRGTRLFSTHPAGPIVAGLGAAPDAAQASVNRVVVTRDDDGQLLITLKVD